MRRTVRGVEAVGAGASSVHRARLKTQASRSFLPVALPDACRLMQPAPCPRGLPAPRCTSTAAEPKRAESSRSSSSGKQSCSHSLQMALAPPSCNTSPPAASQSLTIIKRECRPKAHSLKNASAAAAAAAKRRGQLASESSRPGTRSAAHAAAGQPHTTEPARHARRAQRFPPRPLPSGPALLEPSRKRSAHGQSHD